MRVLITGGAGFIGSHVVDRLARTQHELVVLDNLDPQVHGPGADVATHIAGHIADGRVEFLHGDVRDAEAVAKAMGGVDAVVHLAAAVGVGQSMYQPHYYTSVNVDGQGVLMEEMARHPGTVRRFVVASSMSIYGEGAYGCPVHGELAPAPRPARQLESGSWELLCPECGASLAPVLTREDKPLRCTSVYAITKRTQEELGLVFGAAYAIPTIALRFFNVFGSRQALSNPYTGVAAIFMGRLKNGHRPLVFEDGRQSRDFIHVSDIATAVASSLEADPEVSGAFNVCTGRPITIAEVAERLAGRLGLDLTPQIAGRCRAGDIRHCIGDPGQAARTLGFEAQVSFDAGLDELLAWSADVEAQDRVEASLSELERLGLVR